MSPTAGYDTARHTGGRRRALATVIPPVPEGGGLAFDFGAGTGWAAELLANAGWDVVAVEATPRPELVARAARAGFTITSERLTAPDLTAYGPDLVVALSVLHHLPDPPGELWELVTAGIGTVVVEIPDRLEHHHPAIAGNQAIEILNGVAAELDGQIVHRSPSAFVPDALRPLIVWDPAVNGGTVQPGGGHSTREWPAGGVYLEQEFNGELYRGTLNLGLTRPLPVSELAGEVDTPLGVIRYQPITIEGVGAYAVAMPLGHDPAGFTELVAGTRLRDRLALTDGDTVALRTPSMKPSP